VEEVGPAVAAMEVSGDDVPLVGGVNAAVPALEHHRAGVLPEHLNEQQPHQLTNRWMDPNHCFYSTSWEYQSPNLALCFIHRTAAEASGSGRNRNRRDGRLPEPACEGCRPATKLQGVAEPGTHLGREDLIPCGG
jgi:hypothetical protein